MKNDLKLSDINPYVRVVQKISGTKNDFYVPWRIIYDFEFIFVVKGSFLLKNDGDDIVLNEGDFAVIPPFLRHKQEIPNSCSYYACHLDFYDSKNDFSFEDIYVKPCEEHYESGIILEELSDREIYAPKTLGNFLVLHILNNDLTKTLFENMFENYTKDNEISKLILKSECISLISTLYQEMQYGEKEIDENNEKVNLFLDYLSRHFTEKVELVEIAQQYGFSPNYFRKIFKQVTNSAPGQYITSLRIKEAKKLLALNKYSVEKVGEMVGYDDVHYFTRLFSNREGTSPSKYAKEHQKK